MSMGYIFHGDLNDVICDSNPLQGEEYMDYFCPERMSSDLTVRATPPATLPSWAQHTVLMARGKKELVLPDAIGGRQSWSGGDLFVSERGVELLQPHVKRDCEFVRADLENVKSPYYLLWITRLIDALDEERSTLSRLSYCRDDGTAVWRIHEYAFRAEPLQGHYLFRLPGKRYAYDSLENCCTQAFVDLVTQLQLDGFEFLTGKTRTSNVIRPVPRRHN